VEAQPSAGGHSNGQVKGFVEPCLDVSGLSPFGPSDEDRRQVLGGSVVASCRENIHGVVIYHIIVLEFGLLN